LKIGAYNDEVMNKRVGQVSTVAAQSLRSGLRSASTANYAMPRLLTKFGERSFSYAGPAAWNTLPH